MARRTAISAGGSLLAFFGSATTAFALTFIVDAPGPPTCPGATFTTIQSAVNAVPATGSHTIRICAGTYDEEVAVPARTGALTLDGDGIGVVFVRGVIGSEGPIIGTAPGGSGTLNIKQLTVDGRSMMGCAAFGDVVWGIRLLNTNSTITDVVVKNTRDAAGECQGSAIIAEADTATDRLLTVTQSLIQNFNRAGISADGKVKASIDDNLVVGPDVLLPNSWAPNGIQLSRGVIGTVAANEVQGMLSPNPDAGAGSGIQVYCVRRNSLLTRNVVDNSDLGIAIADTSLAKVTNNEVTNSGEAYTLQFIGNFFGPITGCPTNPSPTEDNQINGNKATDNIFDGVALINFDPALLPVPQPRNNVIASNTITRSGISGIVVFDGAGNKFNNNKMSDSDLLGLAPPNEGYDAQDQIPTPNTWTGNICNSGAGQKENQPGLCKP